MKRMNLKNRDLELLKFCGEQKFLLKSQVEGWFGVVSGKLSEKSAERVARRKLVCLKTQGLLEDHATNFSPAKIWKLSRSGLSLLKDRGLVMEAISDGGVDHQTLNHDQWVTQVRLAYLKRGMAWDWKPETVLRLSSSDKI